MKQPAKPKAAFFPLVGSWQPMNQERAELLGLPFQPILPEDFRGDVMVRKESAWFEIPLNGQWIAAYRIAIQNGQPVIGELRVFPFEGGKREAGTWSGEWLGVRAGVPAGGMPARLLRSGELRPGKVSEYMSQIMEKLEKNYPESLFGPEDLVGRLGMSPHKPKTTPNRGRKPLPETHYASIAQTYVNALRSGNRQPVEAVAEEHHLTKAKARDQIHKARVQGFLSYASKQGRAGGTLTARAIAVLKSHPQTKGGKHAKKG